MKIVKRVLQGLGIMIGIIVIYLLIVTFIPGINVPEQPLEQGKQLTKELDTKPSVSRKNVSFKVNETSLSAWLYLPENLSAPIACIIMGHGFGGTKDMGLESYAVRYQNAGFAVLVFDYRHFGESGGEPRQLIWITETDISSTINGVISGRLDRLDKETKRVLQEASVIGRAFFYEILKRITALKHEIDGFLKGLEQLDIIRTRSLQPDLEYMFKHNLTQEVVYNSLLKKERQAAHERIALVMEQMFPDRLPEFCETLAFHFTQGKSLHKAVEYLMKSGEKSLKRYAVEESHQYLS